MGLWDRVRRLFAGNLNALIDAAEDPEKVLSQTLIDMKAEYARTRGLVADAVVHQKKLERDAQNHRQIANDYLAKAKAILSDDDESNDYMAKEAIARKKENEALAEQYGIAAEKQKSQVEQLKHNLEMMARRIRDADSQKGILLARKQVAETQQRIADATATIGAPNDEAFAAFKRIEERIDEMSLKAEASAELAGAEATSSRLLIEDVSFDSDVESEFRSLQKLLGPGSSDPSGELEA